MAKNSDNGPEQDAPPGAAAMTAQRWRALMRAFELADNLDTFAALQAAYAEKHRHYHSSKHIDALLGHLDQVAEQADDPKSLELAIWFHDAIYKTRAQDNEKQSAQWASRFLIDNGVSEATASTVYDLIMATVHNQPVTRSDELLIVDIDLSILGASEAHYEQFERAVRREYRWVPAFLFKKKRREILQSFLDQPRIYRFDYFYERLEQQARGNLREAIRRLGS